MHLLYHHLQINMALKVKKTKKKKKKEGKKAGRIFILFPSMASTLPTDCFLKS